MKYTNKYLILLFCLLNVQIIHNQVIQISIIKSGTHLLQKLIKELTKKQFNFSGPEAKQLLKNGTPDFINVTPNDFYYLTHLSKNLFWTTHCPYNEEYAEILKQNSEYRVIFMYRDPRDQIVSLAHFIKNQVPHMWPAAVYMSLDEVITALIKGGEIHRYTGYITNDGIQTLYDRYLPWMEISEILSVKFEDLIGPAGGGNPNTQIDCILKIANHINVPITKETALKLSHKIYGKTWTFRKGQIGSWKESFTNDHKNLFKQCAGQLLIDLGYETDMNW